MKFNEEKKRSITIYLLEKINDGIDNLSEYASEALNVNRNTIHRYINELVENNLIKRVKRGKYELVKEHFHYTLKRSNGDLDTDIYSYDKYLKNHVDHLNSNIRTIWQYAFSEMINNVMDHSEAEDVTVTIEQDYLNTSVIIEDSGIGIFNKIQKHFEFPTVEDAICELFKGKLTTDSANHSGEGIFFTSKAMDYFYIFSDNKVFTNNKYDESITLDSFSGFEEGTTVHMTLSNSSHKQMHEIFDMYANVDGGFVKTTIPLKNIFNTSPVSRSQARRVCNRLDKFKEVILDFDTLDWMGQGFAHQIFVVYKREHPDIIITPINMSEPVVGMYKHVIYE